MRPEAQQDKPYTEDSSADTNQKVSLTHRRWPSGIPSTTPFWRIAPAVRFIVLATLATAIFSLEYLRSSAIIAFVHGTRLLRFFAVLTFFATRSSFVGAL